MQASSGIPNQSAAKVSHWVLRYTCSSRPSCTFQWIGLNSSKVELWNLIWQPAAQHDVVTLELSSTPAFYGWQSGCLQSQWTVGAVPKFRDILCIKFLCMSTIFDTHRQLTTQKWYYMPTSRSPRVIPWDHKEASLPSTTWSDHARKWSQHIIIIVVT